MTSSVYPQDDPALIEAVKKRLVPPSSPRVPYNLNNLFAISGQFGQVRGRNLVMK
jgi:hypothetical protein